MAVNFCQPPKHRLQVGRHVTHWGMCVPSSCGPRQLAALVREPLRRLAAPLRLSASLSVEPGLWQSSRTARQHPDATALW